MINNLYVGNLNYETTETGRTLKLEPIRRFNLEDAVAIVVDDVDMDGSPNRDVVEFFSFDCFSKSKVRPVAAIPPIGKHGPQ